MKEVILENSVESGDQLLNMAVDASGSNVQAVGVVSNMPSTQALPVASEQVDVSRETLIEVGVACGIGILVGFFLKKYSQEFFFFILGILSVYAAHYFGVIAINIDTVKLSELSGIQSQVLLDGDIAVFIVEWVKSNVLLAISSFLGFLLGLKFA